MDYSINGIVGISYLGTNEINVSSLHHALSQNKIHMDKSIKNRKKKPETIDSISEYLNVLE